MLRTSGTVILVALLAAGCGPREPEVSEAPVQEEAPPPLQPLLDEDVRVILALDRVFQDAVRTGNWELLRDLYDEEAVLMPPGAEAVEGVDRIVDFYAEANPASGLEGFNTDTEVIHGDANLGYHRGRWTADAGDIREGKFLWVLRRAPSGEWRIVVDMFNASE